MRDEERYEIRGKLGEGGRGTVYLAKDLQLNRTVAIKRLLADEHDADQAYKALLTESRALSAINNPHIVRVFDVCQDEEGPYVVMEHLKGKTLHEVVSIAPILEHEFLEIAEQALEALIAAHEVQLLHRDIKPGNLMLTWLPSGRFNLKLLDFGLAKFASAPADQTVTDDKSVVGSIYFMAPEQFERAPLDQRTDLYSLGCVFFFALTGEHPFNGDNVAAVMASHLQGTHLDLNALRPDLPPSLCDWVTNCIARDPDQRPDTAQMALDSFTEARLVTVTTVASQPVAPHLVTGPGHIDPATGAVATAAAPATGQAPTHTTGQVPLQTAPTTLKSSSGIPPSLLITMGILTLLVLLFGAAIYLRPEPGTPAPAPGSPPPSGQPDPTEEPTPPTPKTPAAEAAPAKKKPGKKPARNKRSPGQVFKSRDKNQDGKLSEKEFLGRAKGAALNREKKRFRKLDKNQDGFLTLYEFDPLK